MNDSMTQTPEQIAVSLSKAQRDAVCGKFSWVSFEDQEDGERALYRYGIWNPRPKYGEDILTPLGQQVRVYLLEQPPKPKLVEQIALMIMAEQGCGLTIYGKYVLCCDPSVEGHFDAYGQPLFDPLCSCRITAGQQILAAYKGQQP